MGQEATAVRVPNVAVQRQRRPRQRIIDLPPAEPAAATQTERDREYSPAAGDPDPFFELASEYRALQAAFDLAPHGKLTEEQHDRVFAAYDRLADRMLNDPPPATTRAGAIAAVEIAQRVADSDASVTIEMAASMCRVARTYLEGAPDNGFQDEGTLPEDCPVAKLAFQFREVEAAEEAIASKRGGRWDRCREVLADRRDALAHLATLTEPTSLVGVFFLLAMAQQRIHWLDTFDWGEKANVAIKESTPRISNAIDGARAWLSANLMCPSPDRHIGCGPENETPLSLADGAMRPGFFDEPAAAA